MMRRAALAVAVAIATLVTFSSAIVLAAPPDGGTPVIVVLNDSAGDPGAAAAALGRAHGFSVGLVYRHALRGFSASVPAGRLAALRADPRVAFVELDQLAHTTAQVTPTGISRTFAPGNPELDIDGADDYRVDVDVAVIDTGIDLDHPDLNVHRSTNCSGGSPFRQSCGSGGDDDNGHGTHVAGTIGAIDDTVGVVGVAPGARLWAVKVLSGSGSGYISWIIAGIDYVTANASEIEVANMSLGCECSSSAMDTAITNSVKAGVVYVVAAGNSDKNTSTFSPANHPDVVAVSALADFDGLPGGGAAHTCRVDQDDTLADFSNWGAKVDITAPGVCILSAWPGGGYATISGTSMASPHVAGAAALITSKSKPSNRTQALGVRSTLVSNGNSNWTDDSGDGIKEPLLDLSNQSVFDPKLVATGGGGDGGGGGGGGESPSVTVHVADLDGSTQSKRNSWSARATILVNASNGSVVSDAAVSGTWTWNGSSATASCTTGSDGTCTVSRSNLPTSVSSATFTVDSISSSVGSYNAASNTDPDPDSNGTSITVSKP